ncbi:hypothetical protein PSm6_00290 [Pseudomonas solani]|uniref:Coil containing protein n=1 Tax=Pseudomonas solani TaxID=2731552 RepID=A0ABN6BH58_9PSED|nr:hypothetical protein [Pseudomonas solani]BCD83622.1 hypothetical protein PSm6_00290 [Pseudomonas solani]
MSYTKQDYYAECLGEAFDSAGLEATREQIAAIARDVELAVEHQGMAFYEPPASDRYNEIEREWKARYEALKKEFDEYQNNAETAVRRALRQHSDAKVSIGKYGEVLRHDGRTSQIQ